MNYSVLVNKKNIIKDNYLKKITFVTKKDVNNNEILIEENTYQAYLNLKKFLKTKNIIIGLDSAFRSIEDQQKIYDDFIIEYKKEYSDKVVAPVGHSEHHTGLAIDLTLNINNKWLENNKELMTYEYIFKEINNYLHHFGFILRYPKNKENITGYIYEPWHIRYVGKVVSKIIYDNNWTLEEYLENFSGIIAINKKKGMTSFDIVNEIKHIFGIKKVGHTGTLDPLAEGVLLVAIGKATKIVELLTAEDKEYIATVKLGLKTDTYDITGTTIATKEIPKKLNIQEVLKSYKKTYNQEVPIYSAVKVNGKKLYNYARKNQQVELPKKEVTIKEITLLEETKDTFKFKALVSKGTYIRSLINDIGSSLNTYATMTSLIRTKQGKNQLKDCYTLEEIKNNNYKLFKIEEVLDYPVIIVDKEIEFKIRTGQKLVNTYNVKEKAIFLSTNKKLLGIYQLEDKKLKVWKNFV